MFFPSRLCYSLLVLSIFFGEISIFLAVDCSLSVITRSRHSTTLTFLEKSVWTTIERWIHLTDLYASVSAYGIYSLPGPMRSLINTLKASPILPKSSIHLGGIAQFWRSLVSFFTIIEQFVYAQFLTSRNAINTSLVFWLWENFWVKLWITSDVCCVSER